MRTTRTPATLASPLSSSKEGRDTHRPPQPLAPSVTSSPHMILTTPGEVSPACQLAPMSPFYR